jgi:hypothetical protein
MAAGSVATSRRATKPGSAHAGVGASRGGQHRAAAIATTPTATAGVDPWVQHHGRGIEHHARHRHRARVGHERVEIDLLLREVRRNRCRVGLIRRLQPFDFAPLLEEGRLPRDQFLLESAEFVVRCPKSLVVRVRGLAGPRVSVAPSTLPNAAISQIVKSAATKARNNPQCHEMRLTPVLDPMRLDLTPLMPFVTCACAWCPSRTALDAKMTHRVDCHA